MNKPFDPIDDNERQVVSKMSTPAQSPDKRPLVPAPDDAPKCEFMHPQYGQPTTMWPYHTVNGELVGYVARFDFVGEEGISRKEVMPLSYCEFKTSKGLKRDWRAKAFPTPRPLYRLPKITADEAPVLIVEGEKAADAAVKLFPYIHVTTTVGGSKAARHTDFTPLAGRSVVIWPDADEPGDRYARDVTELAYEAGAIEVHKVIVPNEFPNGWDLADDMPEGWSSSDLRKLIEMADGVEATGPALPSGYEMREMGLYYLSNDQNGPKELWLCAPINVVATTRDDESASWGILLRWKDPDGRQQEWAMPRSLLAGDAADVRRVLLDRGLILAGGRNAREKLTDFFILVQTKRRALAVTRTGWHDVAGRSVFVLPDAIISDIGNNLVCLQMQSGINHAFRSRGDLEGWKQNIGSYAIGNSRLTLAISIALASSLLKVAGAESGGFHFRGASSTGKSTVLEVAGGVWGGGGLHGYVNQWRATDNGLEAVCAAHSDALLCLDELSQIDTRAAGAASYMIANGSGKARATRTGAGRPTAEWRSLFLSTGEIGLADKVAEDRRGRRVLAGQTVRVIDIPADAGQGFGIFENLHEFETADAFARHLKGAASRVYGVAAPAFLKAIQPDLGGVEERIHQIKTKFADEHCPPHSDGQVRRVADRFALVAAAGEIGIEVSILPWNKGTAIEAARICFNAWLKSRGTAGPAEISEGIERVRAIISAHGSSRFEVFRENSNSEHEHAPVRDRLGFRKMRDDNDGWDYYVTAEAWKLELCAGFDRTLIASALAERGLLTPDSSGKMSRSVNVPGHGKIRLYHISGRILDGSSDDFLD